MSYRHETFNRIFGGSIYLTANDVPVTIIEDSTFINNLGFDGGSINFKEGGGLFTDDCLFTQ